MGNECESAPDSCTVGHLPRMHLGDAVIGGNWRNPLISAYHMHVYIVYIYICHLYVKNLRCLSDELGRPCIIAFNVSSFIATPAFNYLGPLPVVCCQVTVILNTLVQAHQNRSQSNNLQTQLLSLDNSSSPMATKPQWSQVANEIISEPVQVRRQCG